MISVYVDSKVKFGMPLSNIQFRETNNRGTSGSLVTDDDHETFSNP